MVPPPSPPPTPKPKFETLKPEKSLEEEAAEKPAEEFTAEQEEEEYKIEVKPTPAPENFPEPSPSSFEVPAVQLIVENIGGLLVPSDTVRVDSETLSGWESTFEGKKIEYVEIETFDGKTARYKVKPIKDSKYTGKGIVQIPEKAQLALEIKKGELVRVKPIIE